MEMRRKDRQMTRQESFEFLESTKVIRLGLVYNNKPYVIPLNHVLIGDTVYVHSAKQGKKIEAIKENRNVCLEADEMISIKHADKACKFSCYFKSVIANGEAFFVENTVEKAKVLNKLTKRYAKGDFEEVILKEAERVCIIGVKIQKISGKKNEVLE